jgi:pantothenate kinase
LIVEGNYLLLDQDPWSRLYPMFDITVLVDVPVDTLRQRLIARWRAYGLTPPEIEAKVEGNDLPNGRLVMLKSRPARFVLQAPATCNSHDGLVL